jgi:serine/threonine protein kinase
MDPAYARSLGVSGASTAAGGAPRGSSLDDVISRGRRVGAQQSGPDSGSSAAAGSRRDDAPAWQRGSGGGYNGGSREPTRPRFDDRPPERDRQRFDGSGGRGVSVGGGGGSSQLAGYDEDAGRLVEDSPLDRWQPSSSPSEEGALPSEPSRSAAGGGARSDRSQSRSWRHDRDDSRRGDRTSARDGGGDEEGEVAPAPAADADDEENRRASRRDDRGGDGGDDDDDGRRHGRHHSSSGRSRHGHSHRRHRSRSRSSEDASTGRHSKSGRYADDRDADGTDAAVSSRRAGDVGIGGGGSRGGGGVGDRDAHFADSSDDEYRHRHRRQEDGHYRPTSHSSGGGGGGYRGDGYRGDDRSSSREHSASGGGGGGGGGGSAAPRARVPALLREAAASAALALQREREKEARERERAEAAAAAAVEEEQRQVALQQRRRARADDEDGEDGVGVGGGSKASSSVRHPASSVLPPRGQAGGRSPSVGGGVLAPSPRHSQQPQPSSLSGSPARGAPDASPRAAGADAAPQQLAAPAAASGPRWESFLYGCRSVGAYAPLGKIDEGTYGEVFAAVDKATGGKYALKKVKMGAAATSAEGFPITALRETNVLLALGWPAPHANIVSVREMVVGSSLDKVYMVMELLEHDLKAVLAAMTAPFTQAEVKCLLRQLLDGVAHLHAHWVVHRDLKPSNLLMDNAGRLAICDFGMARLYGHPLKAYTQPVVTLWYRAPELLLGARTYGPAVDVFSVGCIFAELLTRRPLFRTNSGSESEMLGLVFNLLGTPTPASWPGWEALPGAAGLRLKHRPPQSLRTALGLSGGGFGGSVTAISDAGVELLRGMLALDPAQRISAADALAHRWFAESPPPADPRLMPSFPSTAEIKAKQNAARGGAARSPPVPAGRGGGDS